TSRRRSRARSRSMSSRGEGWPSSRNARLDNPCSEHEVFREENIRFEPLQPVGREIEARLEPENLSRERAPDSRALHEAVAGEPAGRVDAVGDEAEDRVSVGRHVIQTGPRPVDPGARGGRVAMDETSEPVAEERLVDD